MMRRRIEGQGGSAGENEQQGEQVQFARTRLGPEGLAINFLT